MKFSRQELLILEEKLVKKLGVTPQQKRIELNKLFKSENSYQLSDSQLLRWYSHLSYLAFSPTQRSRVRAEQKGEKVAVKKQRNQYFESLPNNGNLGLLNIHD